MFQKSGKWHADWRDKDDNRLRVPSDEFTFPRPR